MANEHAGMTMPSRKEQDSRGENMLGEAKPVDPPEDINVSSSNIEAAETVLQTNGERTLKDAVKPKNKRKMKSASTSER